MEQLLHAITRRKLPCYFVSAHLDDAILSAGGLIASLATKTQVQALTAFTEGHRGLPTLSARAQLLYANTTSSEKLYTRRRQEDSAIWDYLGVSYTHLGLIDGLWRKKSTKGLKALMSSFIPEFGHIYPFYRNLTSGSIAEPDEATLSQLKLELQKYIPNRNALVFCPVGVGSHIDHILVRKAVSEIFSNVIYYLDFPYSIRNGVSKENDITKLLKKYEYEVDSSKIDLIRRYESQVNALFPDGKIPLTAEVFFFDSGLLSRLLT